MEIGADTLFVCFLGLGLGIGKVVFRTDNKVRICLGLAVIAIVPYLLTLFAASLSLSYLTTGLLFLWCTALGVTQGWLITRLEPR